MMEFRQLRIVRATDVNFSVHDTASKEELRPMKSYLKGAWCECDKPNFLVYASDNACPCGVAKHHVHCSNCGAITQVG